MREGWVAICRELNSVALGLSVFIVAASALTRAAQTPLGVGQVRPEVLRAEDLDDGEDDVVDAGDEEDEGEAQRVVALRGHEEDVEEAEEADLGDPGGEVADGRDDVPPLLGPRQLGLVRQAEPDVPLVVLWWWQFYMTSSQRTRTYVADYQYRYVKKVEG